MDHQAAGLFVGAQFATRDDLDAVVNRWARQQSTGLALFTGPAGNLRWTCVSWTHSGLVCNYRDCMVQVEAAYSLDCDCW